MSATITPGTLLDSRYVTKDRIGQGGFSVVWSALDRETNASVAIKVFAPNQGLEQTDIRQFELEKEKCDRLNHNGLIKITNYFVHEESPCLVMPFMSNGSLFKKLKRGQKFSEPEIALLLAQMADALQYLHQEGFIHLDIKPDNILFDAEGKGVLSDFGISADMRSTLMHVSKLQGQTFNYNAPERFKGVKRLTEAVDIFALGVTLYEMVDGLQADAYSIGMEVYTGKPKPTLPKPEYSNRFEQIIHACWNENPQDRPTAGQLKKYAEHYARLGFWPEIEEFKRNEPENDRKTEAIGQDRGRETERQHDKGNGEHKPTYELGASQGNQQKRSVLIGVGIAAGLLLLTGGGYVGWRKYKLNTQLEIAQAQLEKNNLKTAYDFTQKAKEIDAGNETAKNLLKQIGLKARQNYGAYIDKANQYTANKRYDDARSEVNKAYEKAGRFLSNGDSLKQISLKNINFSVFRDSGDHFLSRKNNNQALLYYEKALGLNSHDSYVLGQIEKIKGPVNEVAKKEVNKSLIEACKKGDIAAAQLALDQGANPNASGANGAPAISFAIAAGNMQLVRLLVDKGADANYRRGYLKRSTAGLGSPAVAAAYLNKMEILKYLIETCGVPINDQEYDMNTKRINGWSPLGAAASQGNLGVVQYLAGRGASLNIKQGIGKVTPLMEASYYDRYEVVNYLLNNGAKTDLEDKSGNTACAYAIAGKHSRIITRLGCSVPTPPRPKPDPNGEIKGGKTNSNKNKN